MGLSQDHKFKDEYARIDKEGIMRTKNVESGTEGQNSLQKAWEVLLPYLLYYLAYSAAYIILTFLQEALMKSKNEAYRSFMTEQAATVAGVTGGLGMLLGILPILPMLKRELGLRGSMNDQEKGGQSLVKEILFTVVVAFASSLGLNILLTLAGFADSSQTYQEVADRQYGVAFVVGLILYGLVSPLAEEVVFRGVIFNRMRRLYGPVLAILASGLFFGAFHGNMVQGVYGGCMGVLMAYLYERSGRFAVPFCFHMTANLAVYITAYAKRLQEIIFTPVVCVILLAVAVGCIMMERRFRKVDGCGA